MPDAAWPNLPSYREFSEADHAAHTSPVGIPTPDYFAPGHDSRKATKGLMKFASKPHLKLGKTRRMATKRHKKHKIKV